jgi:hypothetical protein
MMQVVFIGDLVEENGKTVKENNLERVHNVPVGSLVEITYESEYEEPSERVKGLRLFVVKHSRDCDGSPLYSLSFSLTAQDDFDKIEEDIAQEKYKNEMEWRLLMLLKWQAMGKILNGYDEGSFTVIK